MGRNTNTVLAADIIINDKTRAALRNIDKNVAKTGKEFGKVGRLIKASIGKDWIGSISRFGQEMLKRGQEIGGVLEKVDTVFGASAVVINDWAERNAAAFGESTITLQGMAAKIGDLLVPIGFARDEAADFAVKTLDASNALSEWSDGKVTVEDAANRMTKAFLGQRESLVEIGLKLTAADIAARLLTKGQEGLEGQAKRVAEAVATQELILEQSKDALDKYASGTDSVTRAAKRMESQIKDAKDELALQLIPVMTEGFEVAGDFGAGLKIVVDWIEKLPGPIKVAVAAIGLSKAGGLSKALTGVAWIMANPLLAALGAVAVAITIMGSAARDEKAAIEGLRDALDAAGGSADDAALAYLSASDSSGDLAVAAAEAGLTLKDLSDAALGNKDAMKKVEDGLRKAADEGRLSWEQLRLLDTAFRDLNVLLPEAKRQTVLVADANRRAATETANNRDSVGYYADEIRERGIPAVEDLTKSVKDLADEQRKAVDPVFALREANTKWVKAQKTVEELQDRGETKTRAYKDAIAALIEAQGDLNFSIAAFKDAAVPSLDALIAIGQEAGISEQAIRDFYDSVSNLNRLPVLPGATGGIRDLPVTPGGQGPPQPPSSTIPRIDSLTVNIDGTYDLGNPATARRFAVDLREELDRLNAEI